MPSMGFRWNNSAHYYKELFLKYVIPLHDTMKHVLGPSPDDSEATAVTEYINYIKLIKSFFDYIQDRNYGDRNAGVKA